MTPEAIGLGKRLAFSLSPTATPLGGLWRDSILVEQFRICALLVLIVPTGFGGQQDLDGGPADVRMRWISRQGVGSSSIIP